MAGESRKFVVGLLLLLAIGGLIGWFYGATAIGLLAAALLALAWQVRHLLAFVQALKTGDFSVFRQGEGIWQQIYSAFAQEQERSATYRQDHRQLLKEIRKSTNAMPDAAVVLDEDNEIVMCNRAAKRLAGLKPKKDRGQRVDNILRDPKLTALLKSRKYDSEIEIASPMQDDGWLNCRVVPYGADQKLLFLRDVTERIRVNRMRRDFVANASHELRSPLTVISGYLESLADDDNIPTDWRHPIAQMQAQALRMNRIVEELLELSRLESGGPSNEQVLLDVGAMLEAARTAVYMPGATPEIAVRADAGIRLRGNRGEIESLVMNLLSNAVRHTPNDGRIDLVWRPVKSGAELLVEDTGEGIAPQHVPRLTERFFRVDRGRAREDGGVGLGLAIVKHVLGRHDATLEVESVPGEGSAFRCLFPARRIEASAQLAAVAEPGAG